MTQRYISCSSKERLQVARLPVTRSVRKDLLHGDDNGRMDDNGWMGDHVRKDLLYLIITIIMIMIIMSTRISCKMMMMTETI